MFTLGDGRKLVAGIGSPLVDILIHESDAFLAEAGAVKGGTKYVEASFIDDVVARASGPPAIVPGGAACNTIIGVSRLGGTGRFIGKSGSGKMAALFETHLLRSGVAPFLLKSEALTGRVLSIITPDAQRSMLTFLGASAETRPEEVTPECFEGAAIVQIEGYLLFNRQLMQASLAAARKAGARIALDLASFTVVQKAKAFIGDIVDEYVDIVIANEDEARVFTGHADEERAIRALARRAEIAVLKVGKRGSRIARDGDIIRIAARGDGHAVDTTGAGDLWSAGFFYGLVNGYALAQCGELGSLCGYEVCQTVGASIPDEGWERIRAGITVSETLS